MLYCFFLEVLHRVLALTSKSIPLTYISLICVIILLKQTAFQNSLTSFWGVFLGWILQVSSSYTCLQSLYNKVCDSLVHSIIMFPLDSLARMGLLSKPITIVFIFSDVSLTCCLSAAVLLACITLAAQRFVAGLLQIKHTIWPRCKETRLDRFKDLGPNSFDSLDFSIAGRGNRWKWF